MDDCRKSLGTVSGPSVEREHSPWMVGPEVQAYSVWSALTRSGTLCIITAVSVGLSAGEEKELGGPPSCISVAG